MEKSGEIAHQQSNIFIIIYPDDSKKIALIIIFSHGIKLVLYTRRKKLTKQSFVYAKFGEMYDKTKTIAALIGR